MDCIERETEESRLRIEVSGTGNIDWKFVNMSYLEVREVCKRLVKYIRDLELYETPPVLQKTEAGPSISIECYPWLGESVICIAFQPQFYAIQASITGMSMPDACYVLDNVSALVDILLFPPHSIPEFAGVYG